MYRLTVSWNYDWKRCKVSGPRSIFKNHMQPSTQKRCLPLVNVWSCEAYSGVAKGCSRGNCPVGLDSDKIIVWSVVYAAELNWKWFFLLSTRSVLWPWICRKCVCGRGFAPGHTGGTHDALPNPLVGWKRTPFQILTPLKKRTESIGSASEYGLEYAENAFAARALPRTALGELTRLPRPPSRLERGHLSPDHTPLAAFGASTLAPPAFGSAPTHNFWLRHWKRRGCG